MKDGGEIGKKRADMTLSEQEVMRAIWEVTESGETATTKTVRKRINEGRAEKLYGQIIYAHAAHLAEKGYLEIGRTENGNRVYIPLVEKDCYVAEQARGWAEFWRESRTAYVMMALGKSLSKEEKEEFGRYLDELD